MMMQVVSRQHPSIHAAYQAMKDPIAVSVKSVYNKLNGLETGTSAALVRYSAEQAAELIAEVGGACPSLLAGYRVKILDGNWLQGREHRLQKTRTQTAAPLPGKALLVFDPALEAITDCIPSEDAYTQERALLPEVLARVQPGEVWMNEPARDGEDTLYLLSTVPAEAADACTLARLYRERWTLERAFVHLTVRLHCEINSLAYPPGALFGLAMAVVA